jgi:hypothetical protein
MNNITSIHSKRRNLMKVARVLLAILVVTTFGFLIGCGQLNTATGAQLIGSIVSSGWVLGGVKYHVVLYSAGTYMDPYTDYGTVPQAASVEGTFLGSSTDTSDTINYQLDKVPAGEYSAFSWLDSDGNGAFDPNSDEFGFYFGDPLSSYNVQPVAPDIIVADGSIVDVDIRVGFHAL